MGAKFTRAGTDGAEEAAWTCASEPSIGKTWRSYRTNDDEFHRLLSRQPKSSPTGPHNRSRSPIIEIQNPLYPEAMRESLAGTSRSC